MPKSTSKIVHINPPISRFSLSIRPSPIHNFGVFARSAIPSGTIVIEYIGDKITYAEALRRYIKRGRPDRTVFAKLNKTWIIDAHKGNGAEYINHGCAPNLYVWRPEGHIFFCSLRRIEPGEELTVDYRLRRSIGKAPCNCGAANCRGEMNRPPKKHLRRHKATRIRAN